MGYQYQLFLILPFIISLLVQNIVAPGGNDDSGDTYDFVDPKTNKVVLDLTGVDFAEVKKRMSTGNLSQFGAVVVSDTNPAKPKNGQPHKVGDFSALEGWKKVDSQLYATPGQYVKLWVYIHADTLKDFSVKEDHENPQQDALSNLLLGFMMHPFLLIEGFIIDQTITMQDQNLLADQLREHCQKRKKTGMGMFASCPVIIHKYAEKWTENGAQKSFADAVILLKTGRYMNPYFAHAVHGAVVGDNSIGDLRNLHEGYKTNQNQANWADHLVVNDIVASRYETDLAAHKIALAYTLCWTYGLIMVDDHSTNKDIWEVLVKLLEQFREVTEGRPVNHIYTPSENSKILGFARDQRGYFIANTGKQGHQAKKIQTTLPPGKYLDLVNGQLSITVNINGLVDIDIPGRTVYAFAVKKDDLKKLENAKEEYEKAKASVKNIPRGTKPADVEKAKAHEKETEKVYNGLKHLELKGHPEGEPDENWHDTEILIQAPTKPGEYVFLRGAETTEAHSKLAIIHTTIPSKEVLQKAYLDWRVNDWYLEWKDEPEIDQGTHDGMPALGTPMVWTTNLPQESHPLHYAANTIGPGYWYVKLKVKCKKGTEFPIKAYTEAHFSPNKWEKDLEKCPLPGHGKDKHNINHMAKCGETNVFQWETPDCVTASERLKPVEQFKIIICITIRGTGSCKIQCRI